MLRGQSSALSLFYRLNDVVPSRTILLSNRQTDDAYLTLKLLDFGAFSSLLIVQVILEETMLKRSVSTTSPSHRTIYQV